MAFLGIGRNRRINERAIKRAQGAYDEREATLNELLGGLGGLQEDAYADAEMGLNERFGDSLHRVEDNVAADRAGAQRGITRALMAGGGDITGQGATALAGITESGNRTISDAIRGYSDAAMAERRFDLSRGDNMTLNELGFNADLLNMNYNQLEQAKLRELQRQQANKQMFADIIGGIAQGAGSAIGSDRRLKKDITYIDDPEFEAATGVKRASWVWKGSGKKDYGVIAQDLQEVHPELVIEGEDGFLKVNYDGLHELLKQEQEHANAI